MFNSSIGYEKANLEKKMASAESYEEWLDLALELDELDGNNAWKADKVSPDYDYELIEARMKQLKSAKEMNDINVLGFLLRTSKCSCCVSSNLPNPSVGISRNIGNVGNPTLYAHCNVGTKYLIEDYTKELGEMVDYCATVASSNMNIKSQIDFFKKIRRSFGNTALMLSGGAALGSFHIGVITCLFEQSLMPRIISGSSAGSIFASLLCTKLDSEFHQYFNPNFLDMHMLQLGSLEEHMSEEASKTGKVRNTIARFFLEGAIFDEDHLKHSLRNNLGDMTFLEAYNKTRRVLNITVSSIGQHENARMLNYITAPSVVIWSAVAASCALPTVFKSSKLYAKNIDGKIIPWDNSDADWIDGSIQNDIPSKHLAQLFNVNHFIVCQVNPHITFFMPRGPPTTFVAKIFRKILSLIKSELIYRLPTLIDWDIFPEFCQLALRTLAQNYEGDITIVPEFSLRDYSTTLSNPSKVEIGRSILRGARVTWPKLSMIKNNTWLELKLDAILYKLKCKLLESMLEERGQEAAASERFANPRMRHFSDGNTKGDKRP